jgi:hypothetical protein
VKEKWVAKFTVGGAGKRVSERQPANSPDSETNDFLLFLISSDPKFLLDPA